MRRDEKNLRVALRYWRKRRGLSMDKLAKEAHVSTVTIQRIENENLMPRVDVLERLAKHLGITMEDLVVDESEEESEDSHRVAVA